MAGGGDNIRENHPDSRSTLNGGYKNGIQWRKKRRKENRQAFTKSDPRKICNHEQVFN